MPYKLYRATIDKQQIAPQVQEMMMTHTWPENVQIPNPHYHDSKVDDYFHPSTHALYGERAIYSMLHPDIDVSKDSGRNYSSYMTPLMGTVYHVLIQSKLVHDKLVGPEDIEIPLVNEERHWRGHADLFFEGKLVDIKSMNSRSFSKVEGPYSSWEYQLHPYMDQMGLDTSFVLVVEMGVPWKMKEFEVPFRQELLDEIYTKWENVTKALKENVIPETCCKPENSMFCPLKCKGLLSV